MAVFTIPNDHQGARLPYGRTPVWRKVNIPTTALDSNDEQVLLFEFPEDAYLILHAVEDFRITVPDMDSGGTPALVFDIGIGDSDGVLDTEIIGSSTAAQGGADDIADSDNVVTTPEGIDVGGKFLIWDTTTAAATAVAGDIDFSFEYWVGLNQEVVNTPTT